MKRYIALFLCLVFALSLCACGGTKTDEVPDKRTKQLEIRQELKMWLLDELFMSFEDADIFVNYMEDNGIWAGTLKWHDMHGNPVGQELYMGTWDMEENFTITAKSGFASLDENGLSANVLYADGLTVVYGALLSEFKNPESGERTEAEYRGGSILLADDSEVSLGSTMGGSDGLWFVQVIEDEVEVSDVVFDTSEGSIYASKCYGSIPASENIFSDAMDYHAAYDWLLGERNITDDDVRVLRFAETSDPNVCVFVFDMGHDGPTEFQAGPAEMYIVEKDGDSFRIAKSNVANLPEDTGFTLDLQRYNDLTVVYGELQDYFTRPETGEEEALGVNYLGVKVLDSNGSEHAMYTHNSRPYLIVLDGDAEVTDVLYMLGGDSGLGTGDGAFSYTTEIGALPTEE